MNSIKCLRCNLSNFPEAFVCRRCGVSLSGQNVQSPAKPTASTRISIFPILFLAIAGAIGYYFFYGVNDNVGKINANEANRVAAQKSDPDAGLSRTEYDKKRTDSYANVIANSPSLQAQKKHDEETKKAISEASSTNTH